MVLMLFAGHLQGQYLVEKRLSSSLEKIVIEFDQIDHIQLYSAETNSEIIVKAEGDVDVPGFQIREANNVVLLRDFDFGKEDSVLDEDKVCQIVPNFTSYQIYVPANKELYVSVREGNFYTENFEGQLELKIENGIANLIGVKNNVSIYINSGNVYVKGIQNAKLDVKTNLGTLETDLQKEIELIKGNQLAGSIGESKDSLYIRTILANIFLYGSKG